MGNGNISYSDDPGLDRFAKIYGYNNIYEFASENGHASPQEMAQKYGCKDIYDFIHGPGYATRLEPLRKE